MIPPWLQVSSPAFACLCAANFDKRCKPYVAQSVVYIPAVVEHYETDEDKIYRRPNMGIRAQVTRNQSGVSDYDSMMYYSMIEQPSYEKYLNMDEFDNLCVSQSASPSRCECFCAVSESHVCLSTHTFITCFILLKLSFFLSPYFHHLINQKDYI